MKNKRVRIKDIALASGVSTGTVDRVIHNRGNVLPKVKKRVEAVMKELNYQPNIMARTLANNKVLKIAILIPDLKNDLFWEAPYKGIEKAVKANAHFSMSLEYYFYDEKRVETFIEQSNKILEDLPDALILAPIFAKEAAQFVVRYTNNNLPYVLINTHLKTEGKTCYIGQDSFQCGVLAAKLISTKQPRKSIYWLLHLEEEENAENATHMHQKEAGFYDYFNKNHPASTIFKADYSEAKMGTSLQAFLHNTIQTFPKPSGIFISTSKAFEVIESLGAQIAETTIVGFDLLPKNIQYLKAGKIDYLINQNPEKQGYLAIQNLVDLLLLKKTVQPIQYLPLDIIVKENVAYYLD